MWCTAFVAPRHVGSSQTRARTRVPCIGRQILNHSATREVPIFLFLRFSLSLIFENLIMCLAVGLFRGIFFDTLGYLYLGVCFFLLRLGKFSGVISLHKLLSLPLSSSSGTPIMCILVFLWCPISPLSYLHSFLFFFLFALLIG